MSDNVLKIVHAILRYQLFQKLKPLGMDPTLYVKLFHNLPHVEPCARGRANNHTLIERNKICKGEAVCKQGPNVDRET